MPDHPALARLLAHPIVTTALPGRGPLTYREHVTLGEEEARRIEGALDAIRAVPRLTEAVDAIAALEQDRVVAAVPLLAKLWRDCPVVPVRIRVGHALFAIGTAQAHAALQSAVEVAGHVATFLAIKSIVVTDAEHAFDRLSNYLSDDSLAQPGGPTIAGKILAFFQPREAIGVGDERWLQLPVRLLRTDPRWVRRALQLRRDRRVGAHARLLLRALTPGELDRALVENPEPQPQLPLVVPTRRDFVSRYLAGERERVWSELRDLGPITDRSLREEATAVADLTMQRVRTNVERITERLRRAGYPFDEMLPPWSAPAPDVEEHIQRIERAADGPCPISLRAFWRVVGEVNWKHAEDAEVEDAPWGDLPLSECDPLCADGAETAWACVESWLDERREHHPEAAEPLLVELAPDYLHKANISGGAPYGIAVPSYVADAPLENEGHDLPFVEYLRLCFRDGGFSRLEHFSRGSSTAAAAFMKQLRADLEPF